MTRSSELLRGTLDLLILRVLTLGPDSGSGITSRLQDMSEESINVSTGSLYPALQRLERRGLIAGQWRTHDLYRRSKIYTITPAGQATLSRDLSQWTEFVRTASILLGVSASTMVNGAAVLASLPHLNGREPKTGSVRTRRSAKA